MTKESGRSVSDWRSREAIRAWRKDPAHREAQTRASDWYTSFRVRICRVHREYGF
jgi:heme-degrading monooxygenase HmoA